MSDPNRRQLTPVLYTERLVLTLYDINSDIDSRFFLDMFSNPDIIRMLGDRGYKSVDDVKAYVLQWQIDPSLLNGYTGIGLWLVRLRGGSEFIGCGSFRHFFQLPDLGYLLMPAYWGKGYATEIAREIKRYAIEEMGVEELLGITPLNHQPSMRILEKVGLQHIGQKTIGDVPLEKGVASFEVYTLPGMDVEKTLMPK